MKRIASVCGLLPQSIRPIALLALLATASTGHAQIGVPSHLGSASADFAGGPDGASSLSMITSQSVPAGDSVFVASVSIAEVVFVFPPTSAICSDSAGNSYTTDVSYNDTLALVALCFSHAIGAQLDAGATITVNWTGGTILPVGGGWADRMHAYSVSGLASVAPDRTAMTNGLGTTPSSGATANTTQTNELILGVIMEDGTAVPGDTFTAGTNGTTNNCAATGTPFATALSDVESFTGASLFVTYCTVAATGAYVAQGTFGGGVDRGWEALVATYKPTGSTPVTLLEFEVK